MADIEIRFRRPRASRYVQCTPVYPVYCYRPVRYVRVPEVIREVETVREIQPIVELVPKVTVRRWNEIVPREEVRRWNEIVPREEIIRTVEVKESARLMTKTYETVQAQTVYEEL